MAIDIQYNLSRNQQKLFDALRGKFSRARNGAFSEIHMSIPSFGSWQYFGNGMLTVSFLPQFQAQDGERVIEMLDKHLALAESAAQNGRTYAAQSRIARFGHAQTVKAG